MRRQNFQQLVESLSELSPHQLRKLNESVGKLNQQNEVRTLVAEQVQEAAQCPHCESGQFLRWGTTGAGEQRYRCKACHKSFTGLTGTGVNRLHRKDLLLEYAQCMKEGLSIRKTAARLGLHRNVVFRWRHRLMPQLEKHQPQSLDGVAEVDEAFFRESFKGRKRGMPRKAYKRGTRAGKRGLSKQQIPVLTAVARGSRTSHISVLSGVPTTRQVVEALAPVVSADVVLVSDSGAIYKPAGQAMRVTLHQIPRGARSVGPYHIQNVNALHSRMKGWLYPFKGVASKNLPVYLGWFRFFDQAEAGRSAKDFFRDAMIRSPAACLAAPMDSLAS